MGLHQSTNSATTIDSAIVEQYIGKMESLKAGMSALSKENDFLRRRINDLTEYSSILEDDLKREKIKSSEKDQDIDKYAELYRKFQEENESLIQRNNKLLFDIITLNDQRRQSSEQSYPADSCYEKTKTTVSLVRLHKQLENLKYEVDTTRNNLLKEINMQKSSLNDCGLNDLIEEHGRYNQKLIQQGIFVGEKNLQQMEQNYRYLCLKNNERKIGVMKEISKIENVLSTFSEQLNNNTTEIISRIEPVLKKHEHTFSTELQGISFEDDYEDEKMMYHDLTAKLSNELTYFRKILPSGSDDEKKYKSNASSIRVNDHVHDHSDSKNAFKGWSFDVFDVKKS